jgi:nucleoside-diphosphate-sugar epimerase
MTNPLAADLDEVLANTPDVWPNLKAQRIFITGGTGFFGCWLLESFLWANDKLDLASSATVLTRNADAFRRKAPHLALHPAICLHTGDVRNFTFPDGEFAYVIHAATEASVRLIADDPLLMFDTIVQGTQHTLDFARQCKARSFLLTSSGAVYGKQPGDMTHMPEDYSGAPDPTLPGSCYGEGKRAAELLCSLYCHHYGLNCKIARCFAFVGPYFPLDAHFAIGNFLRDALTGGPIHVNGDGTPYRSYLYATDLVMWLWTILMHGKACRPYNVGSESATTILGLAGTVADTFPGVNVQVAKQAAPGSQAERYVPSTLRARTELGLRQSINLAEAIERTILWHILPQVQAGPQTQLRDGR